MIKPILYFIKGSAPTTEEFEDASQYINKGPILKFVSLVDIDLNGPKLEYSEVKGTVPECYKSEIVITVQTSQPIDKNEFAAYATADSGQKKK